MPATLEEVLCENLDKMVNTFKEEEDLRIPEEGKIPRSVHQDIETYDRKATLLSNVLRTSTVLTPSTVVHESQCFSLSLTVMFWPFDTDGEAVGRRLKRPRQVDGNLRPKQIHSLSLIYSELDSHFRPGHPGKWSIVKAVGACKQN